MNELARRIQKLRIRNIILLTLLIVIAVTVSFGYFLINTETHKTLREAKNITMYFDLMSVEMYGAGKQVYSPYTRDGLADGVAARLEQLAGEPVDVRVREYDMTKRKVISYEYENNNFRVSYTIDDDGKEEYVIDRLVHITTYSNK